MMPAGLERYGWPPPPRVNWELAGHAEAERALLDAFASGSHRFPRAYSAFPSSLLGMTSMFTGQAPTATRFYLRDEAPGKRSASYGEAALPAILSVAGYRTVAVGIGMG